MQFSTNPTTLWYDEPIILHKYHIVLKRVHTKIIPHQRTNNMRLYHILASRSKETQSTIVGAWFGSRCGLSRVELPSIIASVAFLAKNAWGLLSFYHATGCSLWLYEHLDLLLFPFLPWVRNILTQMIICLSTPSFFISDNSMNGHPLECCIFFI